MSKTHHPTTNDMGKKITIEKLSCTRCDHQWWPEVNPKTDKTQEPKNCPKCKSKYWNKPIQRPTVSKARKK